MSTTFSGPLVVQSSITATGTITPSGGVVHPVTDYAANGAIAVPTAVNFSVANITKATAAAMTLADPASGTDGAMLLITVETTAAHVVTLASATLTGSNDTITFSTKGEAILLVVVAGEWHWIANQGAVLSAA